MQVVCTFEGPWKKTIIKKGLLIDRAVSIVVPGPKKGDIVTVTGSVHDENGYFYNLEEWTDIVKVSYHSRHFTKIDEIREEYVEVELSKISEKVPMPSVN